MDQGFDPLGARTLQDFGGVAAENTEDRIATGIECRQASAVEQGEALPLEQLLGGTKAARTTGSEDDRAGFQTGCGCGWMVPIRSRRKPALAPASTAWISATIASAMVEG